MSEQVVSMQAEHQLSTKGNTMLYQFKIGEEDFAVAVEAHQAGSLRVTVNGTPYEVGIVQAGSAPAPSALQAATTAAVSAPAASRPAVSGGQGVVPAPIPGLIVDLKVRVGDTVKAGQTVAVMEAMKMENNLVAPVDGVVKEVFVQKGSEVATGDRILRIG